MICFPAVSLLQADAQALNDVSETLAAANARLGDLDSTLHALQEQSVAAQAVNSTLQHSFNEHMADRAMHAAARTSSHDQLMPLQKPVVEVSHSNKHAVTRPVVAPVSAQGQLQGIAGHALHAPHLLEDLQVLAAKVAALEHGLSVCQASQATSTPARRLTSEPPAASKLMQALAEQLSDLQAEVALLSASRQQSPQHLGASSSTGSSSPRDVPSNIQLKAASAVDSAGRWGIAMAAELDGRLAALEADMQDVKAAKADQAQLQDIRMGWEKAASQVGAC